MEQSPKSNQDKAAKRKAFEQRTASPVKETPAVHQQLAPSATKADVQRAAIEGGGKQPTPAQQAETAGGPVKSEPLSGEIAKKIKDSLGSDLSDVVVRSGPGADDECKKRGCSAYALGNVITMGSQAGEPGSAGYDKILLHECAHIVQKRLGKNPDPKKAQARPDAAQPAAAADPKAPAPKQADAAAPKAAQQGTTAAKEKEADQAATAAQQGKKGQVRHQAAENEAQHAPPVASTPAARPGAAPTAKPGDAKGAKPAEGEQNNPSQISIPIGDRAIVFTPPARNGDWQLGISGAKKLYAGTEKKVDKWWRKNIPTPFFGLSLGLGIQAGVTFKVGEVMLNNIVIKRRKDDKGGAWYEVEGNLETGVSTEGSIALTAGVVADAWVAEAGVGIKAKLGLSANKPASAAVALGYNPTTGDFGLNGKLSLAAWEMALKGTVGLFAYYDAVGVSTYTKDWWLYERTLGKMTLAGVDFGFGLTKQRGFYGEVKPKPLDLQDLEGNVRSAFPSRN
ncbi:MAG: DUF4157 domain-containing protein [Deltaproteobacteria bacterium]|nr:DUF4157 domain-containing protein [Deltaproteobacteria bacterium]